MDQSDIVAAVPLCGRRAGGRLVWVSVSDYELVSRYRWNFSGRRGCERAVASLPAAEATRPNQKILMHVMLTGRRGTDHWDGCGLHNWRGNLRKAGQPLNMANMIKRAPASSRYKGVHWDAWTGRWRASITVDYKSRKLGRFDSEAEAARAYDVAALAAWGEFARLNFPLAAGGWAPPGPAGLLSGIA